MTPKFITTIFTLTTATALVPCVAFADLIEAQSTVIAATLYPNGGHVTRHATVSVPAGQHQISFFDIPVTHENAVVQGLQTQLGQAKLGPVSIVNEAASEQDIARSIDAKDALGRVQRLEAQLRAEQRQVAAFELEASAAEDSLTFINSLETPEDATGIEIAALALAIREQSLQARLAMQEAKARAVDGREALEGLLQHLADARAALQKLASSSEYRAHITLEVDLAEAAEVEVTFMYDTAAAYWRPTYKARVDTVENTLVLDRSIAAGQATGEPWVDVDLSFSTEQPSRRIAPSDVAEYVRRVFDPSVKRGEAGVIFSGSADIGYNDAPMVSFELAAPKSMSMDAEVAQSQSYGLSLTFNYGTAATLFSSAKGATDFALGSLPLAPDLFVRAVPLYDDTGFLIAKTTNESGEALLPGAMQLFRDGALIGDGVLDMQANGAEFEMAFGAIDGIKVSRVTLDRNEGDRGFISKSNETSSSVRLDVENLTARTWPIEILDRVSVSEQDDLMVDWSATPMPSEQGVNDRRGVLRWRFDLATGEAQSVTVDENLRWPEEKVLR
jgi:uncharacterized protein (TIGR02231 family)